MSMYGNDTKDEMYDHINAFLEEYPISVLMIIVAEAIETKEYLDNEGGDTKCKMQ